jgi:hypothetical protein
MAVVPEDQTPARQMRRVIIFGTALALLAGCLGVAAIVISRASESHAPTSPRAIAQSEARRLGSPSSATERSALAPDASAALPAGRVLPIGSNVRLTGPWHQQGAFANSLARVTSRAGTSRAYELGFMRVAKRWLITFVEPT